jgi:signal transduction histidine kinase
MAMSGAEQRAAHSEPERATALLQVATLIAREAPDEIAFAAVAERLARCLGTEAAAVLRFLGDERGVVVGVWNEHGVRAFPVNAELDFNRTNSAAGRVRWTGRPARVDTYEHVTGELPVQMRASDLRSSVAAPVAVGDEVWGAVVAVTTRDQPLPADSEQAAVDFAELVALAVTAGEARRQASTAQRRIVQAGDEARQRLERELHRGVQQHFLALTLKLRIALSRADAGSELARLLEDALAEADVANTSLRELARSLYPIMLTERGLAAAVQALTARAHVPVHLRELPSRRFPQTVEATAYFVVADTLAVVPADAGEVVVTVSDRGDHVAVELRNSGGASFQARLPDLAGRVGAVGGHLHVGTLPEGGTAVRAEIPVR